MIGFDTDTDASHVAAEAYQKGARFCCRYLCRVMKAEIEALHAAGLAVVLIWEHAAHRALDGYDAGVSDGRLARAEADALGAPPSVAVYATVDFDVEPIDEADVINYCRGFAEACGVTGIYANGAILQACIDQTIGRYRWIPDNKWRGSQAFIAKWAPATTSTGVTIIQDIGDKAGLDLGINIDSDTAMDDDIGAWLPPVGIVVETVTIPSARELQHALNVAGASLREDGDWGPLSSAALTAYYRNHPG